MNKTTSSDFYSQLHSTYNLDEAFKRSSTSQNSQNYEDFISGKSKQEKKSSKDCKSAKTIRELSFDKIFLKQHLKVMEKYLPFFSRIAQGNKYKNHSLQGPRLHPWLNGINRKDESHPNVENQQVISNWQNSVIYSHKTVEENQGLRDFVVKCMERVEKSDWSYFLAMTDLVWSKYCHVRDFLKEMGSIINYSQTILGKLLIETMHIFGLHHLDARQTDEFSQFLRVYFITLVLVANQYFQNPYYEEGQLRRIEEDSDYDFFEREKQGNRQNPRKIAHQV